MNLHDAIFYGQEDQVPRLIGEGTDINAQGGLYGNALQAAACKKSLEIVKLLLEKGADIHAQGGGLFGNALQAAIHGENLEIVKLLLEKGADIHAQEAQYGNALQGAAIHKENLEIVKLLLKKGADINAQGGQYGNALQAAVSSKNLEIVKLLLEEGADIHAQGGRYGNALQAAAYRENLEIVKLLLEKGADINAQGGHFRNALQAAAYRENLEIVRLLLEKGADINAQGGQYGNALQAAVSSKNLEIVKLLLEEGADINAQGGHFGNALQAAASGESLEIVKLLLEKGADINAQGGYYGNALQAAVSSKNLEIVKLILEKGADIHAQGGYYGNALYAAAYRENLEIVKLLLEKGADINAQGGDFGNALHAATSQNRIETMLLLLEKGADINSQSTSEGQTPLHLAVEAGSEPAVAQLLEKGALANRQDFGDLTPLQLAAQKQNYQIALLLLSRGTDSLNFVKASMWKTMFPSGLGHLEMAIENTTTVTKTSGNNITKRGYPLSLEVEEFAGRADDFMGTDIGSRRIFILDDGLLLSSSLTGVYCRWWRKGQQLSPDYYFPSQSADLVWRVQPSEAPSRAALSQILKKDCFVECRFTTRAISLPISPTDNWPTLSDTSELDIEGFEKTYGILWIMTKRQDTTASESALESRIFFSTSEYAQVPPYAIDLFAPLVQQLRQEWDLTFQAAENRLAIKRTELLRASGRNPRLIRDLLGDAQLWDLLQRSCNKQIDELMEFWNSYQSQAWAIIRENVSPGSKEVNEAMKTFHAQIEQLEEVYLKGLKALTNTSNDLIQLEFNLTSIWEAQKSASTNKSMKRLSWITFVFLPLMFISSLFGMNIDILASNPPWWFYLIFAVVTTLLTLVVWLIFKRNTDLENSIERGFNRLTRRQPQQDLEKGQRRNLSPQRRSAKFSILGKKRS